MLKSRLLFILLLIVSVGLRAQVEVPSVYSKMFSENETLFLTVQNRNVPEAIYLPNYTVEQMTGNPVGTETGIQFDFQDSLLYGTMYYGFIHYNDSKHPLPVYFRATSPIFKGRAFIDILNNLSGRYDMIGWQKTGQGNLGYRVAREDGRMIYDGKVGFKGTGPFEIAPTIIEGPFVNILNPEGATITFQTNQEVTAAISVDGKDFSEDAPGSRHQIHISGLQPDQLYDYTVSYGGIDQNYQFRTAPEPGTRKPFTFAYASDSRSGQGGGERNIYGANAYIMKKIMAASLMKEARFFQFTGDLINGYLTTPEEMHLQYANWKRSVEAYGHYIPIYVGMGNHESLSREFFDTVYNFGFSVDRFPFETESSEAIFMQNFHMPTNGPESEDGAYYDPNPDTQDFPSYKESVYYYTYDNVAMVVLNADYWYAPSLRGYSGTSGNLHGYIMDQQLEWLKETLMKLEKDNTIDHVFVTLHTPMFPNGGHVADDMWYNGKNDFRPFVSGRPVRYGIIERRDHLLDLMINKNNKVVAVFTGDEHNYNRIKLNNQVNMYPEMYFMEKVVPSRSLWQINNGAAGAPYYAQEETPWSEHVQGFTTQNALVLIHVDGKKVLLEVINPDTLETIDEAFLKE